MSLVSMFDLASDEPTLTHEQRRRRRESRSAWLRLLVLMILAVNLAAATSRDELFIHVNIVAGYGLVTFLALALAISSRGPRWIGTAFVVSDAALVVVMFHDHLLAPTGSGLDYALTAPTLAMGFVLLTHVALRLQPDLVLLFSTLVIVGWLSLLAISIASHPDSEHSWQDVGTEVALAAAFAFAAMVCWLLTKDHTMLLRGAVSTERKRKTLARFFSPQIVAELEATGTPLELKRRDAAVMFVDLWSFTRFSETVPPEEVAELLAEYRELVTQAVFRNGGVIDKFIGDGVMAAFGQPRTADDDAERALRCALDLSAALRTWKDRRLASGKQALVAGIGLHRGIVIGGILESGAHDEFTLLGDAVNVAQRLERLCRTLDAAIVVSSDVTDRAGRTAGQVRWTRQDAVEIGGRAGRLSIAYLPQS